MAARLSAVVNMYRRPKQVYIEPFVGGGNSIACIDGERIGGDIDKYAIEALKLIRDNPESLPKDRYDAGKEKYKYYQDGNGDIGIRGYYGYALSFGGKWYAGYPNPKSARHDYIAEAYRAAKKQSRKLKGVELLVSSYDKLQIPDESIIYCDPPYEGVTGYKDDFDHFAFWEWADRKSDEGHTVIVSEYKAPKHFVEIASAIMRSNLNSFRDTKYITEKIFIDERSYKTKQECK